MTLSPNTLISTAPFIRSTTLVRISLIGFDLALTSIAHTPNRSGRLPKSVPVETSDRDALGDGEDALVTTDGDLACWSIENIDANRDLALRASKPSMIRSRAESEGGEQVPEDFRKSKNPRSEPRRGKKKENNENWCQSDQKVKKALGLGQGRRGAGEGRGRELDVNLSPSLPFCIYVLR